MKKILLPILFILIYSTSIQAQIKLDILKDSIQKILADKKVKGLSLALVQKDSIHFMGGIGFSDTTTQTPVTHETLFRVGSVTKSFIALGILQLEAEGKLSVNDKLKDVLPELEFQNQWADKHPVRIIHLLEHTAGFDDMHFNEFYNFDKPGTPMSEILKINPRSRTCRWQPGLKHSYSNPGYGILGFIIEKISGQSYEDYVTEKILRPCGMKNASLKFDDATLKRLSKAYKSDGKLVEAFEIALRPAGMLNASSGDMAHFMQVLLNYGTKDSINIFSKIMLEQMEKPSSTLIARNGYPYGYASGCIVDSREGVLLKGHAGGIDGFLSNYIFNREKDFGIFYSYNNMTGGVGSKVRKLCFEYFGLEDLKEKTPEVYKMTPEQLRQFEGVYKMTNPRNQMMAFISNIFDPVKVFADKDTLYYSKIFSSETTALLPVSSHSFRKKDETIPTHLFQKDNIFINNTGDGFHEKQNGFLTYLTSYSFAGSFILGVFSFILWIILGIFKWRGKLKSIPTLKDLFFFGLAPVTLLLGTIFFQMNISHFAEVAQVNLPNIVFTTSTILYAIFVMLGSYYYFKNITKQPVLMKIFMTVLAALSIFLLVYFIYFGVIGLRIWAY